ncbi:hypothetical protein D5085_13130 [Ectothiorhodospiraceae bacterium BW-2]|nr:hypothetical protein D5085_13130 [Ectothiorhodospiraceae bacterium BW-2]
MARAFISLIVIIVLLIFASQNMEEAEIHVVTGKPMAIPMILIIAVSFICGYAVAMFSCIIITARKRKSRDGDNKLPRRYPR